MKQNKMKLILLWALLVILIVMVLALNYIKFFADPDAQDSIESHPVENSNSEAIHLALEQIVDNFNKNEKIQQYQQENVTLKATLNNYSIFISYITDTTTTYEFYYSNLYLDITVKNEAENLKKFKTVYGILIEAVQERIGNKEDIRNFVTSFLDDSREYVGLKKTISDDGKAFIYSMNITKKLEDDSDTDDSLIDTNDSLKNALEDSE